MAVAFISLARLQMVFPTESASSSDCSAQQEISAGHLHRAIILVAACYTHPSSELAGHKNVWEALGAGLQQHLIGA